MDNITIDEMYSSSTLSFEGLDFDYTDVQIACNDCYGKYLAGEYSSSSCPICFNFTPKSELKILPFFDFLWVALAFCAAFFVFKLFLKDIWTD